MDSVFVFVFARYMPFFLGGVGAIADNGRGLLTGLQSIKKTSEILHSEKEITLQACGGWVVWWGAATPCYTLATLSRRSP